MDASLPFVEGLYADFLRDPLSVAPEWRDRFSRLPTDDPFAAAPALGPSFRAPGLFASRPRFGECDRHCAFESEVAHLQDRVDQMVRAYRVRGHLVARVDPLGLEREAQAELDPGFYGFTEADMDRVLSTRTIHGPERLPLRRILERLRNTYCRSIGVQFMHIDDLAIKNWLQERMEGTENRLALRPEEQRRILTRLTDAVIFEEFIQRKYVGAKSFSLEGSESLIPLLDLAIEKAAEDGVGEIVLGMAHRGRLNVLAHVVGKSAQAIFREFEDAEPERFVGRGDVKYHLGFSADRVTSSGRRIHISLCFNPSHLEFADPIALGRMRAKQDRKGDAARDGGMVLLIHGDAAFAGEGVVQETLNMSQLDGYAVGGTLHVVVNNQIGFTTPPSEGRSSVYPTDAAKMLQVPIFHVNGEDPEAVAQVVRLAMDFRRTFRRDVVVDMWGYRRHGHNEGDEPAFTQPLLYRAIGERKSVREGYLEHLLGMNGITRAEADEVAAARRRRLEEDLAEARHETHLGLDPAPGGVWVGYAGGPERGVPEAETSVEPARLAALLDALTRLPDGFRPHPKIARLLEARREMARGERPLDWAAAEALAFASLAVEGRRVRLTGQDSERGTFSHRHAVLHDVESGRRHMPLAHLDPGQARVEIRNSPLSEAGVLGFEYGYSLDSPEALVLWEAQFGDFSNAAQVIIDQFLVSAEEKWGRLSGLVLLLPHGFEGMGPEHSSARLERFLSLAAAENIQVASPSTPAQLFHLLRRQVVRVWRKPLVVMTPKSLLRHPRVVSPLDDLARGSFRRVLADDPARRTPAARVVLCAGKIHYDLLAARDALGEDAPALVRLEQLYPFPEEALEAALAPYPDGTPVVWAQEEPENMGAWRYLRARFGDRLLDRMPFSGVYRRESASPATGSAGAHKLEQVEIVRRALAAERTA